MRIADTEASQAMITELGGYPNDSCKSALPEMLQYMADNDVYIGWTAWAAGPLWGPNSPCCNDGVQAGSLEPGSTTSTGQPGLYDTVWTPLIQPKVPKDLKWSGVSSVGGCNSATA